MKRLESGKSHSWWWDSHVSPKNNKWLAENLEEMDRSVKRMLKLIEEEGDSFAKKAEMYYQKRPELISQVEDFYRMYRSLAERYDNLTGELRKNIHSELQTQGSGISDVGSESGSPLTTPDRRLSRRRSSHRAAGFEFFLGSGGSPDVSRKASDESSSTASDSGSESDDASSKNNSSGSPANGDGAGLRRRIIELEVELRDMKEKFHGAKEENAIARSNYDQLRGRITWYEEELKVANEKLQHTEEEIARLKLEFEKAESLEITRYLQTQLESAEKDVEVRDDELKLEKTRVLWLQERISELEANVTDPDNKIGALEKELTLTNKKLEASDNEIARLILLLEENKTSLGIQKSHLEFAPSSQDAENRQVDDHEWENSRIAGFDVSDTDSKIKALEEELRIRNEKRRFSEEEIVRLKLELENKNCSLKSTADSLQVQLDSCCRDIESWEAELQSEKIHVKELQGRIFCLEGEVSNRDHEIGELKEAVSAAEHELALEKSQLQTVISGLSDSRALLQEQLKEWELKGRSLEGKINRVEAEKIELQVSRGTREEEMQIEMERLRADMAERSNQGAELNNSLDALKQKQSILMEERDGLNGKVVELIGEVRSKNNQILQMEEHLHRLHLEHVELIAGCEGARKLVEELRKRLKEAHGELERQRVVISDGAEQKREAIRQLCFSLDHYRNRYHRLRKAFQKSQGSELLAS